eukprot:471672-Amphidinium_carterae.1
MTTRSIYPGSAGLFCVLCSERSCATSWRVLVASRPPLVGDVLLMRASIVGRQVHGSAPLSFSRGFTASLGTVSSVHPPQISLYIYRRSVYTSTSKELHLERDSAKLEQGCMVKGVYGA